MTPSDADLLAHAIHWATMGHRDQRDKSGDPYILHPLRVMRTFLIEPMTEDLTNKAVTAVLHDMVEDVDYWTLQAYRWRLTALGLHGSRIELLVQALDAITHREGETNQAYMARVVANPLALAVKEEDVGDNVMLLWKLREEDEKTWARLRDKYRQDLEWMQAARRGLRTA